MSVFAHLQLLPRPAKAFILIGVDAVFGAIALWLAVLARTGKIPNIPWYYAVSATLFVMFLVPVVGFCCGLYLPVVRFHIPRLSARVGLVSFIAGCLIALGGYLGGAHSPRALGLGAVFALVLFALIVWSRHTARVLMGTISAVREAIPVAIYGAGESGRQLLEILRRGRERVPVVFIDDDASLRARTIEDLLVVGSADKNLETRLRSKRVKEILLALPSVSPERRREILEHLSQMPFQVRSVPSLSELVNRQERALADLRDVSISDLLGREPVSPIDGLLEKCVSGKVVLVTGGGGSIGSELCRQIIRLGPRLLIVVEHSEFALYQIQQELNAMLKGQAVPPCMKFALGSVIDPGLVPKLLNADKVDTVYHAAAYKHVPIVENNAVEGLRNNVLGTWYVARAAALAKVEHFVLISSDKAVRPTNVMGATKRMSELVVQMLANQASHTIFSMVRFGNVLDSSGSVVPLFRNQIEKGGPVTLTHPDVTRYFMTIEEAVQLVIQAGAMAKGGEVFVLDMGHPVRIADLAVKMIHLSGRSLRTSEDPGGDIEIMTIGLRPGEKLYEELLISGEATSTMHPRIFKARENSADSQKFETVLHSLAKSLSDEPRSLDVQGILGHWVDGYRPPVHPVGPELASVQTS